MDGLTPIRPAVIGTLMRLRRERPDEYVPTALIVYEANRHYRESFDAHRVYDALSCLANKKLGRFRVLAGSSGQWRLVCDQPLSRDAG